ncbi:hypothetical protein DPMN_067035 [Dreissena polymorpha]|uniref:Uncharacterized protein n=1 Tax=Dreissena polymorpha TaxID=45954 RepID=A0A9D3YUK8_DREPO|nr:hypothetical protein DPMN_067035 [Dreissena polymorpha]
MCCGADGDLVPVAPGDPLPAQETHATQVNKHGSVNERVDQRVEIRQSGCPYQDGRRYSIMPVGHIVFDDPQNNGNRKPHYYKRHHQNNKGPDYFLVPLMT